MSLWRLLPRLVLLGHVVFAIASYASLPSEFPAQFDLSGRVSRVAARTPAEWFAMPLTAAGTFALLLWIRARLPQRPEWFNFPGKEEFLDLPRPYQSPVIVEMQRVLDVTATLTLALLFAVQVMLFRTATQPDAGSMHPLTIVLPAILMGPIILLTTLRVQSAVDAARQRWTADGRPAR
jgi:hypothetical protein